MILNALKRFPSVFLLALLLALTLAPATAAAQNIIKVTNPDAQPVVDEAHILTPEQISDLRVRLRTLEDIEGTQIVVLTVPTTGDEDIFTFSQRTFTEWGIGQKKDNNGGLFVVAVKDRKMRIHTGYGLEGALTDALSKRIIETKVAPRFRSGDYYGGISDGVDAIISAVKGEYTAPPETSGGGSDTMFYIIILIFILFFLWSVWQANSRGGGGGGGGRSYRRSSGPGVMLPNIWTTGGGSSSGGWGHSGGDGGGGFGGFGGGFGGGSSGGGGASGSW